MDKCVPYLPSFLFNTALDQLTKSVRKGQDEKEEVKLFPFVDNMFLYMEEDPEDHQKTLRTDEHLQQSSLEQKST